MIQVPSAAQYATDLANFVTLPDGTTRLFVTVLHSRSISQWGFPDTTEANVSVTAKFP